MDLTNEDVADVLALLDSLPYDELDLQTSRFRLILRRTPHGWTQSVQTRSAPDVHDAARPAAPPAAPPTAPPTAPSAAPPAAPDLPSASAAGSMEQRAGYHRPNGASRLPGSNADGADEAAVTAEVPLGEAEADHGRPDAGGELVAVRAPLPGTFYRAPRPGAAPFVEVGSQVGPDTVVGIVETMKLMNSVTAGVAGTVAEICLGNAEFASHGAALLRIRAD
jgi:acetyl-CoA carboxylase biotin carboxyl carrier protein